MQPKNQDFIREWRGKGFRISHALTSSSLHEWKQHHRPGKEVRMHFGLKGSYQFSYQELGRSFNLAGEHNNLMFSDGMSLAVYNHSTSIETFGLNLEPELFLELAERGSPVLKKMAEQVAQNKACILDPVWKHNSFHQNRIIQEIILQPFQEDLQSLFLFSRVAELLALQAALYSESPPTTLLPDQQLSKIHAVRDLLNDCFPETPALTELAQQSGLNVFQLKKGFKACFGMTIFQYVHRKRMELAHRLLVDSQLSIKEIAYDTGYNSPQYFSKAFRKEFGATPKSVRKNPDSAMI